MNLSARPSGDLPTARPSGSGALRRLGDRNAGLELEAGVVGRGIDRHRGAGGLHALLVERVVDLLERLDQRLESRIPVGRALAEHDGLRCQRHILAERIGGACLARRGRRCWRREDGARLRPTVRWRSGLTPQGAQRHCGLPFERPLRPGGDSYHGGERDRLPNPAALMRDRWRRAVLSPYNLARNQHPMSALANHAFVKMNGLGNEIVVVDMRAAPAPIPPTKRAPPRSRPARPTTR